MDRPAIRVLSGGRDREVPHRSTSSRPEQGRRPLPQMSHGDNGVYWKVRKLEPNITLDNLEKMGDVTVSVCQSIDPDVLENLERS